VSADTLRRLCAALIGVWCAAATVVAQGSTATIEVRVQLSGGSSVPLPVQLGSVTSSQSWSADIRSGEVVRFRLLLPGKYRLVAGGAERQLEVWAGDELTVDVIGATTGGNDVRVARTDRASYGTQFNTAAIERLPESGGVFGLIERSDPLVVTELIEGGGAYMEPQRLGASGASWTQTSFRLGDADVTDPDRTGFAMFYPNLDALQAVSVTTAGLHPGGYGSGTSVMLVPRMPAPTWQRTIEFYGSPPALQSVNPLPDAPSIARLRAASGASFVLSGPVNDRLGVHIAGSLAASSRFERDRQDSVASRTGSLSAHLVYAATPRDDVRLFVETDQQRLPAAGRAVLIDPGLLQHDRSLLMSSTWNRTSRGGLAWSANLAYGYAASTPALSGTSIVGTMERLRDGPVEELASSSDGRRHRTSVSWRGDPGPLRLWGSRHRVEFGSEASWTGATRNAPGDSLIGELVDGQAARAWQYTTDGISSRWGGRELALWATDGIPITSNFDIDLSLRASASSASREGASADIRWRAMSPAMSGTWRVMPNGRFTLLAGYARYAPRLPLNYLRFGDPHALTGTVHRWTDRNQDARLQTDEVGLTIAAVGPCCANGRLNTIAADLHPPSTKEIRAAIETRLTDHLVLRLGGTDRRQSDTIQPVNRVYHADNYSVTYIEDPGLDSLNPDDDQMLPIFNRLPASFGTDSYVLQNVDGNIAMDHGVDLVLERVFDGRWGMIAGATAHKSNGTGGNRGFRPDENDQGVLGEAFSDPNASTHARGRLFFERGYVIKWSAMYELPYHLRGATAARYQDGQHFSRVVLADNVRQGREFIAALPRGLTRFTYAFTLDTRLERQLRIGRHDASVIFEIFNLLNTNNEVEEDEVTGPAFRAPTAVQPPLSVRLGFRLSF
jgi:hypothetical protein